MVVPHKPGKLVRVDPASPLAKQLTHDWTLPSQIERRIKDTGLKPADGVFGSGTGTTTGNYWRHTPDGPAIFTDPTGTGTFASLRMLVGDSGGSGGPVSGARFTLSARLYLVSGAATQPIYAGDTSGSLTFRTNSSNNIEIVATAQALDGTSSGTLPTNRWCHAAVSYDGATLRFYINGLPSGTASVSRTYDVATQYAVFRDNFGDNFNTGSGLSSLRVWNRVLTPTEIFLDAKDPWSLYKTRQQVAGYRLPRKFFADSGAPPVDEPAQIVIDNVAQFIDPFDQYNVEVYYNPQQGDIRDAAVAGNALLKDDDGYLLISGDYRLLITFVEEPPLYTEAVLVDADPAAWGHSDAWYFVYEGIGQTMLADAVPPDDPSGVSIYENNPLDWSAWNDAYYDSALNYMTFQTGPLSGNAAAGGAVGGAMNINRRRRRS